MESSKQVAFVIAASARAIIRALGMQAENEQRIHCGESIAYNKEAFEKIIEEEGIYHNAICRILYE